MRVMLPAGGSAAEVDDLLGNLEGAGWNHFAPTVSLLLVILVDEGERAIGMAQLDVAVIQPGGMRPEKELQLAKAALMYADSVEIASATLWIALIFGKGAQGVEGSKPGSDGEERPNKGMKRYRFSMELGIDIAKARNGPQHSFGELIDGLDDLRSKEMKFSVNDDLLDDESLRWCLTEMQRAEHASLLRPQWDMEVIRASLSTGRIVPFWDEGVASELGFGHLTASSHRAREARLASDLLAEIPVFPNAPMDVLLDVRERLKNPRARLRVALATAAHELQSVPEGELSEAIEVIRRTNVETSLLEIDETLEELKAKPSLSRMAGDRMTMGATTATVAVAASGFLGPMNPEALVHTAAVPAITAAVKEWSERRRLLREAARQPYWLLSEVRRSSKLRK